MIVLLTTGGTIACTHDETGALVPTKSGADLLEKIKRDDVHVRDLTRLDSSSITLEQLDDLLEEIANALEQNAEKVVVTHGTDSMEESAFACDLVTEGPVVFTGAQRPFDDADPDGPKNLELALTSQINEGTHIAFGGKLIPARGARKVHTSDLDAFANPLKDTTRPRPKKREKLSDYYVPIVAAFPGAPASVVIDPIRNGANGLVVMGMGSGNVSDEVGDAIVKVRERGFPVVLSTRVPNGEVHLDYGGHGGGATLANKGVIAAGGFSPAQARIALLTALATGTEPQL